MNNKFDELAKGMAQSVTRRGALKKFGAGFAGLALAALVPQAYGGGGVAAWTNLYTGAGSDVEIYASAIAVDRGGNVFVTGWSGYGGHDDYVTVAYSGAGLPLWTNRYNSSALNPDSRAHALAITSNGNVVVAGHSTSINTLSFDWATVAYSSAGVALWTNRHHGLGNGDDAPRAAAADNSGNVFVTGSSTITNGYYVPQAYTTIAYSGAGLRLWTNYYNSAGMSDEVALAIAVDGNGNVFVTGSSGGFYGTVAYSAAGVPLWTNRYSNGPLSLARAIAVDRSGNVFVTGYAFLAYNPVIQDYVYQYGTVAYSGTAGVPLWTNLYNGAGNYAAKAGGGANAIAVDGNGNVFVTGYSYTTNSYTDYETVAYSGAGVPLWTNRYGRGSQATAIAVDRAGNVFVTGSDYASVAYSGTGVPLWTNRYQSPNAYDYGDAHALTVDSGGNLLVTGGSMTNSLDYEYVTIKYSSSITPVYLAIEPDSSGGYLIRFNGVPGSTYRLQRTTSLTGPWTTTASQTAPASGLVEFRDMFPPDWPGLLSDRATLRSLAFFVIPKAISGRKAVKAKLNQQRDRKAMNDKFDERANGLAQSVTRRGTLKKFGLGLAGLALASLGLANKAQAKQTHKKFKCQCHKPPYWGCTTQDCFAACQLFCV